MVKLDENNCMMTSVAVATTVPGIFAAGDVVSGSVKRISVAVGQGTTAAISAGKYIDENVA